MKFLSLKIQQHNQSRLDRSTSNTSRARAIATLVLIVLALFGSRIRRDWVFRLAALGALAVSLLEVVRTYTGVELAFLDLLPLASLDFGWVLPAAVCGAVGALIPGGRTAAS